jgi:DNA transformation protein
VQANDFVEHCLELLQPLGQPRAKRMFGGYGLYLDDLFIAIIADEQPEGRRLPRAAFEPQAANDSRTSLGAS